MRRRSGALLGSAARCTARQTTGFPRPQDRVLTRVPERLLATRFGRDEMDLKRAKEKLGDPSRLPDAGKESHAANGDTTPFAPKTALVLTKLSRFQFETRTNPGLSQEQLRARLKERGSDYNALLERHKQHAAYLDTIQADLRARSIEVRVVQRWDYDEAAIEWADVVFSAGGDGTFLLAASKVSTTSKPVIGINTDPDSSEGYLCLIKKLPESHFSKALDRLLSGNFSWIWRQRIRVTLTGKKLERPIELHDMQLMHPEHRWSEHVREHEETRLRSHSSLVARPPASPSAASELDWGDGTPAMNGPVTPSSRLHPSVVSADGSVFASPESIPDTSGQPEVLNTRTGQSPPESAEESEELPFLALNDIFIGESLSARVSYYELTVDDGPAVKQKSSGLTVCTGTGSTSWFAYSYFNIAKLTQQCAKDLLDVAAEELGKPELAAAGEEAVATITRRFNDALIFSPSEHHMGYAIRDPVYNATFAPFPPRGFATKVRVKSRCFDAHLVMDGGMSYIFNDGASATLQLRPEDALRTIVFR